MQPVPTDLILHALAENLIGMEGNDESLRTLGHTILRTCIDLRALPAQWCNGAGVGQQMSWLTRRIAEKDCAPNAIFVTTGQNGTLIPTGPHVAAETRTMEVAISRRLADTAFSLLVTQDDGDKTAALALLEAAHRVVGLPGAEARSAEDRPSWTSWGDQVLGTTGASDAWIQHEVSRRLAKASTLVAQHEEMYAALCREVNAARTEAAAHFEDVKTARDEADTLRQRLGQLDAVIETNKRLQQAVQSTSNMLKAKCDEMAAVRAALGVVTDSHEATLRRIADIRNVDSSRPVTESLTWIARFNNGNGGASITLDGRTVLVTGKMADDLAEALHPRRRHVTDLKDKVAMFERDAWMPWARNLIGVDDGTAQELQELIGKVVRRAEASSLQNLARHDIIADILAALKLDLSASQSDIIETIKGLQADRATLAERVVGDAPVPVEAPRFKVGDRVIYAEYSKTIVWTVEQVQDDGKTCHLQREFHPAMVAARTSIFGVPVTSITPTNTQIASPTTERRACPHRPDGDTSACDHCCLFG